MTLKDKASALSASIDAFAKNLWDGQAQIKTISRPFASLSRDAEETFSSNSKADEVLAKLFIRPVTVIPAQAEIQRFPEFIKNSVVWALPTS